MGDECLSSLALLHLRRDINVKVKDMVDECARHHPRRLKIPDFLSLDFNVLCISFSQCFYRTIACKQCTLRLRQNVHQSIQNLAAKASPPLTKILSTPLIATISVWPLSEAQYSGVLSFCTTQYIIRLQLTTQI